MIRRLLGATLLLAAVTSCNPPQRERKTVRLPGAALQAPTDTPADAPAPSGSAAAPALPSAIASAAATVKPSTGAAVPAIPLAPGDICHITRGPVQLPLTGHARLVSDEGGAEPRFVFNQNGVPRAVGLPAAAKPAPAKKGKGAEVKTSERLALSEPAERASAPGCAAAGGIFFCLDKAGGIHRSAAPGQEGAVVAQARAGSPLAASVIGGTHVVYAFLADRRTTEGATTIAFAGIDDATPVTLSEDGAGATFVTLAPRGDEVLALYVDARRVLTPVHARVVTGGAQLGLGPDAVVFVGPGTDGRLPGAIAQGAQGSALAVLATEKDEREFGMAAIRIDEQPRDDAPVTWSIYPAAMERATVAVTQGITPIRVLRVRPASAEPKAKKILELGELDAAGAYKPSCPVAEGASFTDLMIAADRQGAVWLGYTDSDGTWVEKRGR